MLARFKDLSDVFVEWIAHAYCSHRQFRMTINDGEQIIKIVCNPSGEPPEAFQFLGSLQLFAKPGLFLLGAFLFSYVQPCTRGFGWLRLLFTHQSQIAPRPPVCTIGVPKPVPLGG